MNKERNDETDAPYGNSRKPERGFADNLYDFINVVWVVQIIIVVLLVLYWLVA